MALPPRSGSHGHGVDGDRRRHPPTIFEDPAVAYERFLLATEGAGVGTYDIDLESGAGVWSPRAFAMLGIPASEDGSARLDSWRERIHDEDRDRILQEHGIASARGGAWQAEYRIVRADNGEIRWLQTFGHFSRTAEGHLRSSGVVIDITEKKAIEASLRDSESRLRRSQEAGGVGSYEWRMDGSGGTQSDEMLRLIGLDRGRNYPFDEIVQAVVPEDMEHVKATTRAIREGHPNRETYYRVKGGDKGLRWIRDIGQLELDENGRPYRWVGIVQDVTDLKRNEERQLLLINELNHRVKNTLTVVQSLAHQTFRVLPDAALRTAFEHRLMALASAHDLLTKGRWQAVSITELVHAVLRPLGTSAARISLSGPDLQIMPKAAVSLSMALHELGTNALKYGSLTVDQGRIEIDWALESDLFRLTWQERGGPVPAAARATGFGTRMIELVLAAELEGVTKLTFPEIGVRCEVAAPLRNVVEGSARRSAAC